MKRSTWTLAVSVLVAASSGVAAAQPTGGEPGGGETPPPPVTTPTPPPPATGGPPPTAPTMTPVAEAEGDRPTGLSIGLGAGYTFPTMLDMINTFGARVRLGTGLTIEPVVIVENISDAASHTTQIFSAGANVRYPVITHGKFDFELIGGAGFATVKTPNAGTPDTDSDRSTSIALQWGLAVAWWISPHFEVSVTGTNPLLSYTSNSSTVANSMSTSTSDIGLIFNPKIGAMLHIYY